MFNNSFYPTPKNLASKVWYKLDHKKPLNYILEPSAGKGDICDYLKDAIRLGTNNRSIKIDCIEIHPELSNLLFSKGYSVVGDDFLTFKTHTRYDAIVMNPPFDEGDKHLLRAIELIEPHGGQIACLLNAETIKNPHSNSRKALTAKLELLCANIEYIPNAFYNAERKTNVEVAFVYINIERPLEGKNIFNEVEFEVPEELKEFAVDDKSDTPVRKAEVIINLIKDYEREIRYIKRAAEALLAYRQFMIGKGETVDIRLALGHDRDSLYRDNHFNEMLSSIRKRYWSKIVQLETFSKYLIGDVWTKFQERINKQSNIEFNYNNLMKVICMLSDVFSDNVGDSALKIFDDIKARSYHEFSTNIHLYNGWKTNNGVKVNKKIIVPTYDRYYNDTERTLPEIVVNFDKVLNYFDGFNQNHNCFASYRARQIKVGIETEFEYFTVKAYKKGTFHITVKRLDLLDRFNIYVGQHRNWLPHPEDIKTEADRKEADKIFAGICESNIPYQAVLAGSPFNTQLLLEQGKQN